MRYRPDVLRELARHGLRPEAATPPQVARDFVYEQYRYEIRRLRARMLRGEIPKPEYAAHVVELRRRYPVLSLPLAMWTEEG